jgi:hypothetical protein
MRKTLLRTGMAMLCVTLFFPSKSDAQLLNWLTSYLPSWSNGNMNGTAYNVSGMGVNCTTAVSISGGSFSQALGSSGAQTPTVSGATFIVPGSSSRLQVTPNFSTNTNYVNIVMTFSAFVTNVSFRIVDIDKSDATSTTYYDRVTITGSNGVATFNPTISRYDAVTQPNFLVISGNTARVNTTSGQAGNTDSDASDQRGTVNVSFGSLGLKSVTIRYDNAPGADANPAAQAIGVGSMAFVPSATLPVILSSFTGAQQGNDVVLKWATAQEINAASFVLERNEANNWQAIATIAARGNTSQASNYTYTDPDPAKTILLYRLKQIDLDGNYKYSSIVRITNKDNKTEMIAYPNPFISQINISVHSFNSQQAAVRIVDVSGKIIRSVVQDLYKGNNNFSITGLEKLGHGIYIVEIIGEDQKRIGFSRLIKN